jgi:Cdc6-like AAA superfamily ATPase
LFCYGIPGAGKTILASIVIEQLISRFHDNHDVGIAYIYCDFRRKDEQRLGDLLASLVKQLSETRPSVPDIIKHLYQRHQSKRTRPSTDELSGTLQPVLASYSRVFIIIDALDECSISDGC